MIMGRGIMMQRWDGFTTNDRFAEKYYSMSLYQYGANSPVVNIDVNGDSIRICTSKLSPLVTHGLVLVKDLI